MDILPCLFWENRNKTLCKISLDILLNFDWINMLDGLKMKLLQKPTWDLIYRLLQMGSIMYLLQLITQSCNHIFYLDQRI